MQGLPTKLILSTKKRATQQEQIRYDKDSLKKQDEVKEGLLSFLFRALSAHVVSLRHFMADDPCSASSLLQVPSW